MGEIRPIRTIHKEEDNPAFEKILLQEKHWWGWKTISSSFKYPLYIVVKAVSEELEELEKEIYR